MTDTQRYITVDDVSFGYEANQLTLDSISLIIGRGEFVAVIGPSGCGKSTLLRLLAGLVEPTRGKLTVDGQPICGPGLDRAVVFQDYSLFPWMTCRDNIVLALEQAKLGANKTERRQIALDFLSLVGLAQDGDKLPGQLSGGMRQRTAIARALAINAPILLMDEPFGALDEITRARQQDLLLDLWQGGQGDEKAGKTVFFVTHDVEEAVILGDRVMVMGTRPGRLVRDIQVTLPRPRTRMGSLQHPNFSPLRDLLLNELNLVVDELLLPGSSHGAHI
ncbi:MAG: ABC transporter ATP-binding protein [Deltaproteobacteria bacterium]|jgi:NitT/TauT family transport system ATP-binding protein|nr:ABC transporter ATP-binding protein [Deltaproteobacteria bacterium]